jgi:hypothetical protein
MNPDELMLYTLPGWCDLPKFPPALPDDELRLLATLPDVGTVQLLEAVEWPVARALAARGLVKISKCDGELWAERLPASSLRLEQ